MGDVLDAVVRGVMAGSVYGLLAAPLLVVILATGVFNFAQPHMTVFTALWAAALVRGGLPWLVALPLMTGVGLLMGGVTYYAAILPVRKRISGDVPLLVSTLGVGLILETLMSRRWGDLPQRVPLGLASRRLDLGFTSVTYLSLLLLLLSVVAPVVAHICLQKTRPGRAALALSSNRRAAQLQGIRVQRVEAGAFAAAGALSGALGLLVGSAVSVVPGSSLLLGLKAFVALAFGGFNKMSAVVIGGFIIGIMETTLTLWIDGAWRDFVTLGALVALLVFRPQGIAGRRAVRTV